MVDLEAEQEKFEKYLKAEQEKLLEHCRSLWSGKVHEYSPVPFEIQPWNHLTVFLVENSDNSDITKNWMLGIRYHNNTRCNWRICYPREVSCRPLRLELYFIVDNDDSNDDNEVYRHKKTRLYPSCYFINMPNKYKTIKTGETYDHIINITPWRRDISLRGYVNKERVEGIFSIIIIYPHVHHYSVGCLRWQGWY
uniref:Uncharacterized protein n=1 Tax=Marseillevirus LCMAC101 TaxID=2506602 RepID=A0A481YQG2_9VIRU|nr:MAG: hypothetical protein LCMAC101_00090 [Marseillevirus LCMAC101]